MCLHIFSIESLDRQIVSIEKIKKGICFNENLQERTLVSKKYRYYDKVIFSFQSVCQERKFVFMECVDNIKFNSEESVG